MAPVTRPPSRSSLLLLLAAALAAFVAGSPRGAAAGPFAAEDLTARLPDPYVTALAWDGARVWVGTWKGVAALDPVTGDTERYAQLQGLECPSVTALAASGTGELWIGASQGPHRGLYSLKGAECRPIPLPGGPANVTALLPAAAGLYVGTFGRGLMLLTADTVEIVVAEPAHITALVESAGRVYAASRYSGALRLEPGRPPEVLDDHTSDLAHNCVSALLAAGGEVWFGHWAGASVLSADGKWESYFRHERQLPHNHVKAFAADARNVYLGTDAGLSIYNRGKGFMNLSADKLPLPSGNVLALLRAGRHLYVGTDKGMIRLGIDEH